MLMNINSTLFGRLATALPWAFPKKVIVLQDFMLPRPNVSSFITDMQSKLSVWPIWLLPMKNIKVLLCFIDFEIINIVLLL